MLKSLVVVLCSVAVLTHKIYGGIVTANLCNKSTDDNKIIFKSPEKLIPGNCTLELIVKPDICGLRIDFDELSFDQPTKEDDTSAYTCATDLIELKLCGLPSVELPLSLLCGTLTGQHIYVSIRDPGDEPLPPLGIAVGVKLVLTVVYLGINGVVPGTKAPSWNIKLTQLPCAGGPAIDVGLKNSLAPIGCLQYHLEKSGEIESLNYLNGLGHYFGDLNYAICFKRYTDTCGIKLTPIEFKLASNGNSSCSTERDCDTLDLNVDVGLNLLPSKDALIVPNGLGITVDLNTYPATKYCGSSLELLEIIVTTQGPLYVGIVTDAISDPLKNSEVGFKIKYELLTDCKGLSL